MDAPVRKYTYFLSDLHLGAAYYDNPREHERCVVRWLRSIAPTAERIYLLGDVLDYWYEYRYVVPRGFTRFLGAIAELADSGIEITWFIGNHDIWIFDYLPQELGVRIVDGSLVETIGGKRFFMSHGDGVGRMPVGFRIMRGIFRNRICQRLFAAIHPRWTVGAAYAWSAHNRKQHHHPESEDGHVLEEFCREYLGTHGDESVDWFVFGHYHVALQRKIGVGNAEMIILGDWIDKYTFAVFDGEKVVLRSAKESMSVF